MTKFLLKGDISGIQEFIFNVSSKNAAKMLKAKSFIIEQIGKLAYQRLLKDLSINKPEGFYEGGGAFFIWFEAEKAQKANEIVESIRKKINKELVKKSFTLNLSYVVVEKDFGATWKKLREQSNKDKLSGKGLTYDSFQPFKLSEDIEKEEYNKYSQLESDIYRFITDEMVKQEKFFYKLLKQKEKLNDAYFDGKLSNKLPFWEDYREIEAYQEYRENNKSQYNDNYTLPDKNLIDFDAFGDFAAHRTGTNKLGIAKLDVDNLGKAFGELKEEKEGKELSEKLKKFFNEELFKIFNKNEVDFFGKKGRYKANIYPVFAGGDDCFLLGAWDALLCFVKDLHQEFTTYFEKEEMTISAGIVLVSPTFPVKSFAEIAEDALGKAKSQGKNRICLFDLVFSWKDFSQLLNLSSDLATSMEENKINRSFLSKVTKSAKGFNALQNSNTIEFDRVYKLKYYLSKSQDELNQVVELLFEPYYNALKNRLLYNENKLNVSIYPAAARITELLTKSTLDYEQ